MTTLVEETAPKPLHFKGKTMPNIKIISEQKKPFCPTNSNLSKEVPRFKPPGGKPGLPLGKSYNRQGVK